MAITSPDIKGTGEGGYRYGWNDPEATSINLARKGLSAEVVEEISRSKGEPEWMTKLRLKAYRHFEARPMPTWGADLSPIDFQDIYYYVVPTDKVAKSWDDVPDYIRRTYDKLGIPEAEKKYLAGVGGQYDSTSIYHNIHEDLKKQGVIFMGTDEALKEHPELFRKYFGTIVPANDNKLAALNSAVWSGGSFIYVPKGVHIEQPLQAYFRINSENMGQFERTLIIADEGASLTYVEGCLPAGEQISLGDHWANIESVRPGDEVVGDDGLKHRVKAVMTRPYRGVMLRIQPNSSFNAFRLTPEHPVLAVPRSKISKGNGWIPSDRDISRFDPTKARAATPEYIPAKDLKRGDMLVFPRVGKAAPENPAYSDAMLKLLGYYLAEGSIGAHGHSIHIAFHQDELNLIEDVKGAAAELIGRVPKVILDPAHKSAVVQINSTELVNICLRECSRLSSQKQLSSQMMEGLSERQVRVLLTAYIAGDGHFNKRGPSEIYEVATASSALASQLQELLGRMGIFAGIYRRPPGRTTIRGKTYDTKALHIVVFAESPSRPSFVVKPDYILVPIRRIDEEEYDGFVFNMEVQDSNSYLARGFAVHNCTAPTYSTQSLHSAVVEIIVHDRARVRYVTLQSWSDNVYNLVTKRAVAYEDSVMEWIDSNSGAGRTMKYPSIYLLGERAHGEILSVATAHTGQHQDVGGKVIHAAPNTTSLITSKSVSYGKGRNSYRGLVKVYPGCPGSKSSVRCDALILSEDARADTYPYMEIDEEQVTISHEASVSKVGAEQLFYLMSRGLSENEATAMIVNGFIEPIVKELPMEYAVEMNRLIQLSMEGAVG